MLLLLRYVVLLHYCSCRALASGGGTTRTTDCSFARQGCLGLSHNASIAKPVAPLTPPIYMLGVPGYCVTHYLAHVRCMRLAVICGVCLCVRAYTCVRAYVCSLSLFVVLHRPMGEMLFVSTCSAPPFRSAEACLLMRGLQRLNHANRRSSRAVFCMPHPSAHPAACTLDPSLEANVGACEL